MVIVDIKVPSEYGYCILVAVGSGFVIAWKAFQVGAMRKKHKILYPTMYSPDNDLFNCYQRAHQNTLENYPQFLMLLLLGGLKHPCVSAVGGTVWLAGRVTYALGYYTGDPKKRVKGAFGYLGLIAMIYSTIRFGVDLVLEGF